MTGEFAHLRLAKRVAENHCRHRQRAVGETVDIVDSQAEVGNRRLRRDAAEIILHDVYAAAADREQVSGDLQGASTRLRLGLLPVDTLHALLKRTAPFPMHVAVERQYEGIAAAEFAHFRIVVHPKMFVIFKDCTDIRVARQD